MVECVLVICASNGLCRAQSRFDVWDDYVATLKRMGVDEIAEITQNAYDRYVNR